LDTRRSAGPVSTRQPPWQAERGRARLAAVARAAVDDDDLADQAALQPFGKRSDAGRQQRGQR